MRRVLFVDDERIVLDGLRRMLRPHRNEWDVVVAEGAEQAILELEKAPFDVVVSDMRMPGIDGLTLLAEVRDRFPNAVRIILSAQTEMETALSTIPVAHQFLSKPCDTALVQEVIGRACRLQEVLRNEAIRKHVGTVGTLPSCPRIYNELTEALAKPEIPVGVIARIVEQDTGLTARILQVVNSGFFGLPRPVTTVRAAVGYLGAAMIRNLALSMGVFQVFGVEKTVPGFSIESEQRHALLTANLAAFLVQDYQPSSEAFTAGILHDVGVLVMASRAPEDLARVLSDGADEPAHQIESRLFGFNHAEVGAYLLGLWGLPFSIVEAVGFHHTPQELPHSQFELVTAVHAADCLAHELALDTRVSTCGLDTDYLARLGVLGRLDDWRAQAKRVAGARNEARGAQ